VLTATHGTGEVARFTALANVLGLTNPVVMSTCGLIVPAVAAARATGGAAAGRRAGMKYALQGAALLLPYYVVVMAFPALVLRVFYGPGSPYLELGPLLPVFALGYAGAFAGQVLCAVLNGLGASRGTFVATVVGAVSNAALVVPLVVYFGLRGSVWAGIGPILAQAAIAGVLVVRARDRQSEPDERERGDGVAETAAAAPKAKSSGAVRTMAPRASAMVSGAWPFRAHRGGEAP
jgi:O-antigen/teichoic acid export membrane protein